MKQSNRENEFNKKLVWENLVPLDQLTKEVSMLIDLANEVADEYEKLAIGKFTQEIYDDLVNKGIDGTKENYIGSAKDEIKRLKVMNPTVRNSLLERIDLDLKSLEDSVNKLKKYNSHINRFNYHILTSAHSEITSFQERRFVLTVSDIERIKDKYCRVFIETQNQQELYDSLNDFVASYDKVIKAAKRTNEKFANNLSNSINAMDPFVWCVQGEAAIYKPKLESFLNIALPEDVI